MRFPVVFEEQQRESVDGSQLNNRVRSSFRGDGWKTDNAEPAGSGQHVGVSFFFSFFLFW